MTTRLAARTPTAMGSVVQPSMPRSAMPPPTSLHCMQLHPHQCRWWALWGGADVWHSGWMRPVPDIPPPNKAVRNRDGKLDDGPSTYARSQDLSTPLKCFQALWNREVTDRIAQVTTAKLATRDKAAAVTHEELLKFFALEITMGLKKQGSVRSYSDTKHFGEHRASLLPACHWTSFRRGLRVVACPQLALALLSFTVVVDAGG